MGLFGALASGIRASYQPWDDFWYQTTPRGGMGTDAGLVISEDRALTFSAIFQGTRLIAETVASLQRRVIERTGDGTKRDAETHPLAPLLRIQANPRHTAMEWFQLMTSAAVLWGNGYSALERDRGRLVALWPWHPSCVRVVPVDGARLAYLYRDPQTGRETPYTEDEVFHLRGLGSDGIRGYSVVHQAREAIGLALAEESHGARVFSQGTRLSGVLKAPGTLSPTAEAQSKASWQKAHQGLPGAHSIAVLSGGLEFQPIGMSQEDAQYIASRDYQVRDVCRWLNISEHFLRVALRPIYATPEQLLIELMEVTIRPWVVRWEQQLNATLIADPAQYFVKFNMDAVHRADLNTRGGFYTAMVQNGIYTRNEVRVDFEDREPIEGGDEPMTPANMTGAVDPTKEPAPTKGGPPRQATAIEQDAAARAVRKEAEAIRTAATPKHLADAEGWRAWVDAFYARHAAYLAELLHVPLEAARGIALEHRARLLAEGIEVLDVWAATGAAELLALIGAPAAAEPSVPPTVHVHVEVPEREVRVEVQPAAVMVPVTVQPAAAAQVTVPVQVTLPPPAGVVRKAIRRDGQGRIVGITEHHEGGA